MGPRSGCGLRRRSSIVNSSTGPFPKGLVRADLHASLTRAAVALLCISSVTGGAQTLITGQASKHDLGDVTSRWLRRQPSGTSPKDVTAQGIHKGLARDTGAIFVDSQQSSPWARSLPSRRLLSEALGGSSRDFQVELPEDLGFETSDDSLLPVRLPIHDQYTRFPPRNDGSALSEPNGLGGAFVVCPAQPCPEMTTCQGHGELSSCWNPDLEDKPVRRRPPVVRQLHPWDMTLNALDLCLENVTGAFGEVVRPGCPWKGDWLEGREEGEDPVKWWREGWAGQVFELHDVYLDSYGRIFNKTHRFDAGGCLPHSKVPVPHYILPSHLVVIDRTAKELLLHASPAPDQAGMPTWLDSLPLACSRV